MYHPSEFSGCRHSDSGYIMVFVCLTTLQNHMIKVLYDWFEAPQGNSPSN